MHSFRVKVALVGLIELDMLARSCLEGGGREGEGEGEGGRTELGVTSSVAELVLCVGTRKLMVNDYSVRWKLLHHFSLHPVAF